MRGFGTCSTSSLVIPLGWLAEGQAIPPGIQAVMANVGEVLRPDMVLKHDDAEGKPILLVALYPPEQDLEKPISGKLWKATAGTRMMELLHAADLPLGLDHERRRVDAGLCTPR